MPAHVTTAALRRPATFRWSSEEYEALVASGTFPEDLRLELIDGTLTERIPKDPRHDTVLHRLMLAVARRVARSHPFRTESEVALAPGSPGTVVQPDLYVARAKPGAFDERRPEGHDLLLVVEVSRSSLKRDLGEKRELYAAAGVPEYWVIDAEGDILDHDLLGEVDVASLVKG